MKGNTTHKSSRIGSTLLITQGLTTDVNVPAANEKHDTCMYIWLDERVTVSHAQRVCSHEPVDDDCVDKDFKRRTHN